MYITIIFFNNKLKMLLKYVLILWVINVNFLIVSQIKNVAIPLILLITQHKISLINF